MATRAQKTKVGAFLLFNAALVAIGLYMVSNYGTRGELHYMVEFHESVLGLNVGSPVVFMGVPIGTVDDIDVNVSRNQETGAEVYIPKADILIKPNTFVLREGVVAKLSIYSLATGTLAITLEGGAPGSPPLPEGSTIPTDPSVFQAVSSRLEEVMSNLQDLMTDLDEVVETFKSGLNGLEEGELAKIIKDAAATLEETRDLAASANETFTGIKDDATEGVKDFRELVTEVKTLVEETSTLVGNINTKLEPLDLGETQVKLNSVLDRVNGLLERLQAASDAFQNTTGTISDKAGDIEYSIRDGLRSMTKALDSLREMIEYLRDNPSALIRGKGTPAGE